METCRTFQLLWKFNFPLSKQSAFKFSSEIVESLKENACAAHVFSRWMSLTGGADKTRKTAIMLFCYCFEECREKGKEEATVHKLFLVALEPFFLS